MKDRDLLVSLHAEAEQILARVRTLVDQLEAALVATHQPPREPLRLAPYVSVSRREEGGNG